MGCGLGKLAHTIIRPVQFQLADQVGLMGFGLEERAKIKVLIVIISQIPVGRPNKIGLMGFGLARDSRLTQFSSKVKACASSYGHAR